MKDKFPSFGPVVVTTAALIDGINPCVLTTIVFILREASLRLHAFGYLVLYNLMFILPLALTFFLVYFGVQQQVMKIRK